MIQQIAYLILQWQLLYDPQITHAKVIIESDATVRVTFGKLNKAGHYYPDFKVRQTVTLGMARVIYDGVGWNWEQVGSFVDAAAIATWGDRGDEK